MKDSFADGSVTEWNTLSMDLSARKLKLVFKAGETFHAVVSNGVLRCKLARALRDNFIWLGTERIIFYDDFLPYHFLFDEIRAGKTLRCGGLVLHGQENMRKSYYTCTT